MDEVNLLQSLGQVSASETGQVFGDFLRGHVREMICEVKFAGRRTLQCVSLVARSWAKIVEQLRSKDLESSTWCELMLDGLRLSSEQTAVAAWGIDSEGRKHVLDFALGSSENLEVSRVLVGRIVARGLACEHRLSAVLDGSDALRGAVLEFFPEAVVQRCLVHKERNIKGYRELPP